MAFEKIKSVVKIIKRDYWNFIFLSQKEKEFCDSVMEKKNQANLLGEKINILMLAPENYSVFSLCLIVLNSLNRFLSIKLFLVDLNLQHQKRGKGKFIKELPIYGRKWRNLYLRCLPGKPEYCLDFVVPKNLRMNYLNKAEKLLSQFVQNKMELVNLKYNEIQIGDLVYDTYLRFKPAPTVELADPFLTEIVSDTLYIYDQSKLLIDQKKIDMLFLRFATYVQHGVLVRLALLKDIPVYCWVQEEKQLFRKLTIDYPFETSNHFQYQNAIKQSALTAVELEKAKKMLESRFSGGIDIATGYMKESSFVGGVGQDNLKLRNGDKLVAIIYLHCFFDSPHIYSWITFPDFYEWLSVLFGEIKNISHTDFYVKMHPNAMPGNEAVIDELKTKFPYIKFLDKNIRNNSIINARPDYALSVYGTVAHELPCFDIPVFCVGDNPHVEFNFTKTFNDKESYLKFLNSPFETLENFKKIDKDEIIKFYYAHNLHAFEGRQNYKGNSLPSTKLKIESDLDLYKTADFLKSQNCYDLVKYLESCSFGDFKKY